MKLESYFFNFGFLLFLYYFVTNTGKKRTLGSLESYFLMSHLWEKQNEWLA
jgi:hypothetical protein